MPLLTPIHSSRLPGLSASTQHPKLATHTLTSHRDRANLNKRLAQLSLSAPSNAQREKDFHTWLDVKDSMPLLSALNLYRDAGRGHTHLVVQEVIYTPKASREARHKFRVLRCGVFRIADMRSELERIMRLDPGEGQEYVDSIIDEMLSASGGARVPFLTLSYGKGVQPWLGGGKCACLVHGDNVKALTRGLPRMQMGRCRLRSKRGCTTRTGARC